MFCLNLLFVLQYAGHESIEYGDKRLIETMNYLIFAVLFPLSLLFYMLEIAFQSFSRISLAGFLDDIRQEKLNSFDFVDKYERMVHALRGLAFFLQLCLFYTSYDLLAPVFPGSFHRILILVPAFLFLFNLLLYTLAFSRRETILRTLLFLAPVAWGFSIPVNFVFARAASREKPDNKENDPDDLSEKELEVFFEESTKDGVLESEDKEMIESVLEFGDTLVKEIITPRVDMVYVELNTSLDQLVKKINEAKKSRYPVISERIDNIEGIILAKDVFDYWNNSRTTEFNIRDILRKPFFIPETMRIMELLKELQRTMQKFAIVVDEFGGISGVVTMEDIIEELVGEIHDEYDDEPEDIVEEQDHFIVKGDADVYDMGDTLKIKIDDSEDYQTVAGLISFLLGRIPGPGDTVAVEGYNFEVMDVEKNRIKKVKITKKD